MVTTAIDMIETFQITFYYTEISLYLIVLSHVECSEFSGIQLFLNILSTCMCFGLPLDGNGVSDLHPKNMAYTLAYTAYLSQVL